MKKLVGLMMVLLLTISTAACGQAAEEKPAETKTTTEVVEVATEKPVIGIVQLIEHQALDNAREGFINRLEELGVEAEIDYKNAQGDIAVARTIAEKFVSDEVDLIFAIATPAAEAAVGIGSDIPILFTAVTDPVAAHLVESNESPGGNVTGTSDMNDVRSQLETFGKINPEIKTIGIIYSADEANSIAQLEAVEAAAPELGLTVESIAIQNISDLPQAAQSIVTKVDGVYMLSDNKIVSSAAVLSDILKENKIPSVCAGLALVKGGGLITNGINYIELGGQTAKMAEEILVEGISPSDIPVETSNNRTVSVNEETLEALGLDRSLEVFQNVEFVKGEE